MKYTTDIPKLTNWGPPAADRAGARSTTRILSDERIPKAQILEAIELYKRLVRSLKNTPVG